ncbi:hypothetical protein AGMMS49928_22330 [Spirochaetia bacterium]|nr:hypothetical protein AGMMS49928_22330 [Spirochaetia bacterium]
MLQFFFLSILLNGIAGYVLISDDAAAGNGVEGGFRLSISPGSPRLILGLLTAFTGLLKVLSVIEKDIAVIGDIVPALAGLAAGSVLILEYYRDHSSIESENNEKVGLILIKNRKLIGFISLAAAALHFFIPQVLFL